MRIPRFAVLSGLGCFLSVIAFAQSETLTLSSGAGSPGGVVSLTISLSATAPNQPASLEWTLGYSAADIPEIQTLSAEYFNCGAGISQSDFFAFNDYSWCNSDYITAGWDKKVQNYTDYSKPIL